MKPYMYTTKETITNDVKQISEYLKNESTSLCVYSDYKPEELDVYLESNCGNYMAIYYKDKNAVGFFTKISSKNGKTYNLRHVPNISDLEEVEFTIEEQVKLNLLTEDLPMGDLLIFMKDGEVKVPFDSFINHVKYILDNDYTKVDKIIYTGISRGIKEHMELDFVHDTIDILAKDSLL
ncbi:hypothetical protein TwortDSMZ_063 [Staphylococcus phage Twort]|uniref:ORF070 n=2 Tax=Staphylococcus phage Twort (strain DSM 17442 / HER 48) TaxID=2908167 RepID=Q4Z8Z6_BPTWO|nr:ORF070 [Staphylococcus phage Twort]AAX92365.1 ORF070 [Staphylococcus phage Twort]QIW89068.1 hypothetical protein TwortDSMZ_063 [Staphylococcus phage Twort]